MLLDISLSKINEDNLSLFIENSDIFLDSDKNKEAFRNMIKQKLNKLEGEKLNSLLIELFSLNKDNIELGLLKIAIDKIIEIVKSDKQSSILKHRCLRTLNDYKFTFNIEALYSHICLEVLGKDIYDKIMTKYSDEITNEDIIFCITKLYRASSLVVSDYKPNMSDLSNLMHDNLEALDLVFNKIYENINQEYIYREGYNVFLILLIRRCVKSLFPTVISIIAYKKFYNELAKRTDITNEELSVLYHAYEVIRISNRRYPERMNYIKDEDVNKSDNNQILKYAMDNSL